MKLVRKNSATTQEQSDMDSYKSTLVTWSSNVIPSLDFDKSINLKCGDTIKLQTMLRLVIFLEIFLFYSCVTSRSVDHFASKRKLVIKKVENISLLDGKIQIENNSKSGCKEFIYLLYNINTLLFLSNTKQIDNSEFIYKISSKADSTITLTRATMYPRYYTADTLLFGSDIALEKRCLSMTITKLFSFTSRNMNFQMTL